jgi:negative regulator of sigma E activity
LKDRRNRDEGRRGHPGLPAGAVAVAASASLATIVLVQPFTLAGTTIVTSLLASVKQL